MNHLLHTVGKHFTCANTSLVQTLTHQPNLTPFHRASNSLSLSPCIPTNLHSFPLFFLPTVPFTFLLSAAYYALLACFLASTLTHTAFKFYVVLQCATLCNSPPNTSHPTDTLLAYTPTPSYRHNPSLPLYVILSFVVLLYCMHFSLY